ncbi:uncharacterized protein LOC111338593 [Stylophora pistillata]|uniref:uncharacterized protein LOC111338593 n=1 Tax=Stylophora pistillata TaxID=50429 RepID=UPI000C052518|nr:uncharacterized protein LOC111338593 [Stylophora pistillata]
MTHSQSPVKDKKQPDQKFKLWQEEKPSMNVWFVLLPCVVAILAAVVGVLITISVKHEAIKSIEATGERLVSALVNVTRVHFWQTAYSNSAKRFLRMKSQKRTKLTFSYQPYGISQFIVI